MAEGWIAGQVIEAALKAAADPMDAASVREALSSVNVDTRGLRGSALEWTAENHFRTQQSYRLYRWNPDAGAIEMVEDWMSYDVQ